MAKKPVKRPTNADRVPFGNRVYVSPEFEWGNTAQWRKFFILRGWTVQDYTDRGNKGIYKVGASIEVNLRITYLYIFNSGKFILLPEKGQKPPRAHIRPWWHWLTNRDGIRTGLPEKVVNDIDDLYVLLHDGTNGG